MKKIVVVFLVLACFLWVWGCNKTHSIATKEPEATNNASQKEENSQEVKDSPEIRAYLICPEGSKVINVFDSLTQKTATIHEPIDERVFVNTGDYDNIPRVVDITTKEDSRFDVLIKGKKNRDIKLAIDFDIGGTVSQESPIVHMDKNGDGWIKIRIYPDQKKYQFEMSEGAQ